MAQSKESDYDEPLDDTPIQNPSGWKGGRVKPTGNNHWCRVWTRDLPNHDELEGLQVEYDITRDETYGGPTATEVTESGHRDATPMFEQADEQSDEAFAQAAKRLMSELNERYTQ